MRVAIPAHSRIAWDSKMGLFHCMAEDGIEDGKNAQFNSGPQGKIAMTTISSAGSIPGAGTGFLDKERTIATAGFNRWLVPPAALCIHLCIGMAYGFSVFWLPLSRALGLSAPKACPDMTLVQELFTTTCDWKVASMGWMFTLFFVLLGVSAAIWGGWLENVGPRKAGFVSAVCWCGGLFLGAMGIIYFVFMMIGAFRYRIPPAGWRPEGWTPPAKANAMISQNHVHLKDAHKTPQFWLIWWVLCLNVSAGIGVIGMASPMLQEIFAGKLIGFPDVGFNQLDATQKATIAGIAAGFAGLLSLFNIGGRFFWASLSDKIGRKSTYYAFFILGIALYALAPTFAAMGSKLLFVLGFGIILSMYGGGFATVPAYLADMFGTQFVGAIHGRLLTAWSTAGIIGPVVVNYIREFQLAAGVPRDQLYNTTMYILCAMLAAGLICNFLIKPVNPKWHMSEIEVAKLQAASAKGEAAIQHGSFGIGKGGLDVRAALFWAVVGIPLAWGVWKTLESAAKIF